MQLYLYSSQDLIIKNKGFETIKANDIYCLNISTDETIFIYSAISSGVIVLTSDILRKQCHNQIVFHKINNDITLCEIKPFINYESTTNYTIKNTTVKIIKNHNILHILFNETYYGWIECESASISFDKHLKDNTEYGIIKILGNQKYIIIFKENTIKYCGRYYDYEILKDRCNIYTCISNIFNLSQLVTIDFKTNEILYNQIEDRGGQRKISNVDFCAIYFVEAIKCGRYKYAYNMLSHELKSEINIHTLQKYFSVFDRYIYLSKEDIFIMINKNKIVGIYNIKIKNNLINSIY